MLDGDRGSNYPHDSDFFKNGDTLFLDTGNVTKNGFKFDNVKYISKEKDKQLRAGKLEKKDFVLTSRGTLGNVGFYDELIYKYHPKIRINSAMLILRKTDEKLSYNYLHTLLKGKLVSDFMRKNQVGSAQPHITKTEFLKLDMNVPRDIKEQQKIGTFFKQLDDTIALHQRKIEQLKLLKQAFLQKMLANQENTPELRFADFDEEWEPRKLLDVANIVGGGTPNTNNPEFWDGDIDWYSPAEIGEQSYVNNSRKKISYLGLQKSSAKILPVGTVLFTSRAGIGNTAILAKEGATNQGFQSIIPHKDKLDSYFIYSRTPELKRYGELSGAGSTFIEVSGKQMANMSLLFPNLKEQQKIGSFFKQIDNTISLHKKKLSNIKKLKKACLQSMFI